MCLRRYPAKITYSTSTRSLPPLSEPLVEPNFQTIEDSFLNVIFLSIPFISDQYEWGPLLKVEEEAIDMQVVTQSHGKYQLLKYILNSSKGDHFDKEKGTIREGFDFTHQKLKSYRL